MATKILQNIPSGLKKSISLSLFIKNNTILIFHFILDCMKHSLNSKEDNATQVCKQWYFRSIDVICGHFLTRLFPVGNSSSKNARSAFIVNSIVQ